MKTIVWNILDMVEELGEDSVKEILSGFSCQKEIDKTIVTLNSDIEHFIKNNAIDDGKRITGKELMKLANRELIEIQHRSGGGIVYLDCEPNAKLINFYEKEGFRLFGERISKNDKKRYLQYMKFF